MFKWVKQRLKTLSIFEVFISISIIVFVVFVIKFFGQKVEWKTVKIEIINKSWAENYNPYGYRTPFWLSDKLKIGQKEYGKSGKVIAEIINVENYERGSEEADVYLTVKLRTTYQKRIQQHIFKNKPLDLGSAIEIAPDQNIVYGQIVDIDMPSSGYPKKTFTVTARGRGIDAYIINNIKINDVMKNRYDQSIIATITSFHTEKTTRIYVSELTNNNQSLGFKLNENAKDVVVTFQVNTELIDGRWYFAGHQQIKVGNSIYFYSQNINLYGLEIEDVK
ncbi:MAG TPA: hypothetical protein VN174_01750 [Candidatus Methanoperedens sp.]|nr:hypothetical protein [Candidatus Methanoperedens sp.]